MPIVQFQAYEQQGIRLPDEGLANRIGELTLFLRDKRYPAVIFPGNEMIDLMPDYLRDRELPYVWLETGPCNPAQTAVAHIFSRKRNGVISEYNAASGTFSRLSRISKQFKVPPYALPQTEPSSIRGLLLHSFLVVVPDTTIQSLNVQPWVSPKS